MIIRRPAEPWLAFFSSISCSFLLTLCSSQQTWRFVQKPSETPKNLANRNDVLGVTPRLPFTSSLMRWNGTWVASASCCWVISMGRRNSSRSIAPGCFGSLSFGTRIILWPHCNVFMSSYPSEYHDLNAITSTIFFSLIRPTQPPFGFSVPYSTAVCRHARPTKNFP